MWSFSQTRGSHSSNMNLASNPYESSAQNVPVTASPTPEKIWRIGFAVSMWVCGVVAIQCIPVYPWTSEHWADRTNLLSIGIHFAWLAPFFCSVASVICAICLFRLPRVMDKLGAVICISVVGVWPALGALNWWYYFATH